jgi:hypothetical protein
LAREDSWSDSDIAAMSASGETKEDQEDDTENGRQGFLFDPEYETLRDTVRWGQNELRYVGNQRVDGGMPHSGVRWFRSCSERGRRAAGSWLAVGL